MDVDQILCCNECLPYKVSLSVIMPTKEYMFSAVMFYLFVFRSVRLFAK